MRFVREKTLLEAIASSLTEMFSPVIISERMSGMLATATFITRETLSYFDERPPQAQRDADFALGYVERNARTPEQQQAVLAALEFKCGVLWAMLDALYSAYVMPKHLPPGAFVPKDFSNGAGNTNPGHRAPAIATRGPADAERCPGRLGAACAGARVQGGCNFGGNPEAL